MAVADLPRQFEGSGAGVEKDAVAVADKGCGIIADGMFRGMLELGAVFKVEFVGGFVRRHRAAVNATSCPFRSSRGEVRADGDG